MTRLARSWTLGWVAAELGLELDQIGEDVGLTPQVVGDHWRLARNSRDHGNPHATALHCFNQRTEIAVTGEQYYFIDVLGEFHSIDCELDVHVALHFAAATGVDEFLGCLGDARVAVLIEPIDQRT